VTVGMVMMTVVMLLLVFFLSHPEHT